MFIVISQLKVEIMRKKVFGQELRRIRKILVGRSQAWLASIVGVHVTYISKIETGNIDIMPSRDLIEKLESALFVDSGYLLDLAGYYDPKKLDEALERDPTLARDIRKLYEEKS